MGGFGGGGLPPQQAGKRRRGADLDFARARGRGGGGAGGRPCCLDCILLELYLPSVLAVAGKAQMSHPLRQRIPDQSFVSPEKPR